MTDAPTPVVPRACPAPRVTTPRHWATLLMVGGLIARSALAEGADGVAPPQSPTRHVAPEDNLDWTYVVVPGLGYNPIDGSGYGVSTQAYGRPAGQATGHRWFGSVSAWTTVLGTYRSFVVRGERRATNNQAFLVGYRTWDTMLWSGVGGDAALSMPGADEGGTRFRGVHGSWTLGLPPIARGWAPFLHYYGRAAQIEAGPALRDAAPLGVDGALFTNLAIGVDRDATNRWPLPSRGDRTEVNLGGGGTFSGENGVRFDPVGTVHLESIQWVPLINGARRGEGPPRLVVGTRVVLDHAFGRLPFFEQSTANGKFRDEFGGDQVLSGYGRTRSRGDGVAACMVEVRPYLFRVRRGAFDFETHLSLFGEAAWLFDRWAPGPFLPSVGVGAELLWKQAILLRPFFSWGWRSDVAGGQRQAVPQFGISFNDPL